MKKLYIVITVDTETHLTPTKFQEGGEPPLPTILAGYENGEPIGLTKLLGVLEAHSVKATFFISILEMAYFHQKKLEDIFRETKRAGHDLQLHIHPVWADKRRRMSQWEYSAEEQLHILRQGIELFRELAGEDPIAHRGGHYYGINQQTMEALRAVNIPLDSTMFYGFPNCKVTWSKNCLIEKDGLIEFPVTGFYREFYLNLGWRRMLRKQQFVKTDLCWATKEELLGFIGQAKELGLRVMNFFMHSHSLSEMSSGKTDKENTAKLTGILRSIAEDPELELLTMKEFYLRYRKNPAEFCSKDLVPKREIEYTIMDKLKSRKIL